MPNRISVYYEPMQSAHPYEMHMGRLTIRDSDSSNRQTPEIDTNDRVLTEKSTDTKENNVITSQGKKTKRGGRKHKKRHNEQENIPVQTIRPDKITDLYLRVMTQFPDDMEEKLKDYFFEGRFDEINCAVIDTNRRDSAGLTILHHAVKCCRYMAVDRLVTKCKANVNAETFRGVTPVFLAATTGYSDVIRILHENGADINHAIKCGMTPLHYAVVHKNHNSVLTLTFLGADTNAPDKNGNTPLHYGAMTTNNVKVVETLVEKGADLQLRNKNGLRALEVAKKGHDKEITQYLASVTLDIL